MPPRILVPRVPGTGSRISSSVDAASTTVSSLGPYVAIPIVIGVAIVIALIVYFILTMKKKGAAIRAAEERDPIYEKLAAEQRQLRARQDEDQRHSSDGDSSDSDAESRGGRSPEMNQRRRPGEDRQPQRTRSASRRDHRNRGGRRYEPVRLRDRTHDAAGRIIPPWERMETGRLVNEDPEGFAQPSPLPRAAVRP
ncbi:hypothetical protein QBC47DRAFT_404967 [Echria macrotheca]|uniref:Uncharacterized protein n=1 Tax=Echria macrotheca TaxID=438768 RepID=A0AAJ0B8D0_9PEZI|nr:hypothetical protein QBC47DRAFT_404967 [Echria macrotheca]